MINQSGLDYVSGELAKGVSKEEISNKLLQAGWQQADLDTIFGGIAAGQSVQTSVVQTPSSQISEKDYPIETKWILKQIIASAVAFLFIFIYLSSLRNLLSFFIYFLFYFVTIFINIAVFALKRKNFHYLFESEFLILKQGILSKQQRHIPYAVIQNVIVKQDFLDRLMGLATLVIENAAEAGGQMGGATKIFGMKVNTNKQKGDLVGFKGNKVNIPGLKKENAEKLKIILLERVKLNPHQDTKSGL